MTLPRRWARAFMRGWREEAERRERAELELAVRQVFSEMGWQQPVIEFSEDWDQQDD